MDDELIDAAERVLFVAVGKRKQEYPHVAGLGRFLREYLQARPVVEGCELPSVHEVTGLSCPLAGENIDQARQKVRPFLVHDAYRDAAMRAGGPVHAIFDRGVLFTVAPDGWVPVIAAIIAHGPKVATARAQAAIYRFSLERVEANRRRPAGQRAAATVKQMLSEALSLFRLIHRLRELPACRQWTYVPELDMPSMPTGGYEVVAPRVELVRTVLATMMQDIHKRLGVSTIEEELAGIAGSGDITLLHRGLWRLMRDRLLLVLMVLTGGRQAAIMRLRRCDYIRDYVGPPPDRRRGAALDLVPQKGKHRDEIRRKPIPRQAALIVDSYLELMDRTLAARGRPPADDWSPLLVVLPSPRLKPMSGTWIQRRIAGSGTYLPLIGKDADHIREHVPPEKHCHCGYTTHEYRHFANQLAEASGRLFNERHPATGADSNPPIPYYAAALLDNGDVESDMRALYGDRRTLAMLEVVAGRASEIGWELLTTGTGERKRPNIEAYEQELIRLWRIEDEERHLAQVAETLQARHALGGQRALPRAEASEPSRLDVVLRRQEDLITMVKELKGELLESAGVTHQLVQLSRLKADTLAKLALFKYDKSTWVPVPDSEPPGAEKVDLDAVEKGVLGKALTPGDKPAAIRKWLTFSEFCRLIDLPARSTVTRWAKGEHLPSRPDRRPWEPDQIPVDFSLGANYRRIWVPGVNERFWQTRTRREAVDDVLSRWPKEQGWTTKDGEPTARCLRPLRIPAPWGTQLAA